jgi:LPXTG-site transpeptidase (sortase) family protein
MVRTVPRQRRSWRRTVVAGGFIAAAGVIAWFGIAGGRPASASPATVTIAPASPAEPSAEIPALPQGGLPTRLVVTRVGIDAGITEVGVISDDGVAVWETAWRAAGHHMDSARPGQPGNMVITGHVSVADKRNLAVFSALDKVAPGDIVEVYSGDEVFRYKVNKIAVVPASSVAVLRSDHVATVTLITCTRDLKSRLVVQGTLT